VAVLRDARKSALLRMRSVELNFAPSDLICFMESIH
jgi:hypothetical protein